MISLERVKNNINLRSASKQNAHFSQKKSPMQIKRSEDVQDILYTSRSYTFGLYS